MSRSFKKPYVTDYHRAKAFFKNRASRIIRRTSVYEDVADGNSYRRYSCSYDICDYKYRYNPKPWAHFNYRTGKMEWVEPDPIYKYNRK